MSPHPQGQASSFGSITRSSRGSSFGRPRDVRGRRGGRVFARAAAAVSCSSRASAIAASLALATREPSTHGPSDDNERDQGQAFPAIIVDHGQNPEPTPIGKGVADEIEAPADVWGIRHRHWPSCPESALPAAPAAHLELLLAVEPPEPLEVPSRSPAARARYGGAGIRSAVARPQPPSSRPLPRHRPVARLAIARARPIHSQHLARPVLAHPVDLHDARYRLPFHTGRYRFLTRHPSGSRCRAWLRRGASSASRSCPRAPSAAGPRTSQGRHTGASTRRTSPCLRHTSAVVMPASCSFTMPMICFSLNLDRFIVRLLVGADSTRNWRKMRGLGQADQTARRQRLRQSPRP